MSNRIASGSTGRKILMSVTVLGAAAAVAGLGTFGAFSSTTSASTAADSGTVVIGLGADGSADNRLNVAATNMVPGDTAQRAVTLTNTGDQNLASISLTTTADPSSLLDTDATNGLQLTVDSCSVAWTESGSTPYTYTCSGTTTSRIASRAVVGSNVTLGASTALTAGASDNIRVTLTFPATAGNTFQGLESSINFAFTGTQRAATNQ